ncbi:SHOCT domain-containing protein [Rhodoferax sediminis]|uniref:SHOCT domain-containing protein n=2 Tax=Rhodoferax sediminis TaxID=2509614 RepID=A0A515DH40_9BURK|nr:SHOCT domain-containing protein [Rhodoferax sediminis]
MKADVIREASQFAAQRGKVAVPVRVSETPLRPCPACFASIEYQFRVVNHDDPEVRRGQLTPDVPKTEITIRNQTTPAPAAAVVSEHPTRDTYTELLKLDDLRKRGVLTEAEFTAEKTRLLQSR